VTFAATLHNVAPLTTVASCARKYACLNVERGFPLRCVATDERHKLRSAGALNPGVVRATSTLGILAAARRTPLSVCSRPQIRLRVMLQPFPNTDPGLAGDTGDSGVCGTVYSPCLLIERNFLCAVLIRRSLFIALIGVRGLDPNGLNSDPRIGARRSCGLRRCGRPLLTAAD
jgi:hypothetical protein